MSIDRDTMAAVKAKWDTAFEASLPIHGGPSNPNALCALIAAGLFEGPKVEPRPAYQYATMECKQDPRPPRVSSGGGTIDYRRLTLRIYGNVQAKVSLGMKVVADLYGRWGHTGAENDVAVYGADYSLDLTTTDFPRVEIGQPDPYSGDWMRTEPLEQTLTRDSRVATEEVWCGCCTWRVWSSRPAGVRLV